jgi:hypothetical protein
MRSAETSLQPLPLFGLPNRREMVTARLESRHGRLLAPEAQIQMRAQIPAQIRFAEELTPISPPRDGWPFRSQSSLTLSLSIQFTKTLPGHRRQFALSAP